MMEYIPSTALADYATFYSNFLNCSFSGEGIAFNWIISIGTLARDFAMNQITRPFKGYFKHLAVTNKIFSA
jgi:hypothetical protein